MQCRRCGGEKFAISRTLRNRTPDGKYSPVSDLRMYRCDECGKEYPVHCVMAGVSVFDSAIIAERIVSIEEYDRVYLPNEMKSPKPGSLFD